MISKEKAYEIAEEYIKEKEFTEICLIENISFREDYKIGNGEKASQWIICYYMPWGIEEKAIYVHVSATTGEVYGSIGPHNWIEEFEGLE